MFIRNEDGGLLQRWVGEEQKLYKNIIIINHLVANQVELCTLRNKKYNIMLKTMFTLILSIANTFLKAVEMLACTGRNVK